MKTLTAAGLALAILAPVANAATQIGAPAAAHATKIVKPHKTAAMAHSKKHHHRFACKTGMMKKNGVCTATIAKKY
jgi:hypothetical protein